MHNGYKFRVLIKTGRLNCGLLREGKMTFEQFQSTRQWSTDLATAIGSENWETNGTPKGNLYLGCLYIDHVESHWPQIARDAGEWHLLLGRNEWITNNLVTLERRLYDWAISEGYDCSTVC